jgi:homoserine kinase
MQNKIEETQDYRKPKRGTIGYAIQQLVKKHGQGTTGLYILESALREAAVGIGSSAQVTIGGLLVHECHRAKALKAEEARILAELRAEGVIS